MKIDILTLFPKIFDGPLSQSLLGDAIEKGLLNIDLVNIRDFSEDKHKTVDGASYGGGVGMVIKPDVLSKAVGSVKKSGARIILFSASGKKLDQELITELSKEDHLILVCGRYEGIDERFVDEHDPLEVSIGDYVLTGGEIAAMALVDAVARFIPGVVGDKNSVEQDSFYEGILDFPHYTRPEIFENKKVPQVLLSGDHKKIAEWRRKQALSNTLFKRPDLFACASLIDKDRELLAEVIFEE